MKVKPLYMLKQAFSQIFRNIAMSLASLFSIIAILLILGFCFVVLVNLNNISESLKENFGLVKINLLDETDEAQTATLMDSLRSLPGVESIEYRTKDDNLRQFKESWGDSGVILDRLEVNPLPNSIEIKVSKLEEAQAVVDLARASPGIDTINYAQDEVNKLIKITNGIQLGALVLILCLLIISIVVVSNTIKLTVLAREREITIMKYVGATNWYIRGPFLMEGILIGLISAIFASALIAGIYHAIVSNFSLDFALILSIGLVKEYFLLKNLVIIFAALGISIGACGSIVSMRRFLDK